MDDIIFSLLVLFKNKKLSKFFSPFAHVSDCTCMLCRFPILTQQVNGNNDTINSPSTHSLRAIICMTHNSLFDGRLDNKNFKYSRWESLKFEGDSSHIEICI
jgi:hypothetical protein